MRIYAHDFAGYGFITDLSRELARRGHTVRHAYNARLTTGQGVDPRPDDPTSFHLAPILIRHHFDKYSLARRPLIEREYGFAVAKDLRTFKADVVLAANTPLLALARIQSAAQSSGAGFVLWMQDLLGLGTAGELRRRAGPLGELTGRGIERLEERLLRRSQHVVAIADAFTPALTRAGVPPDRISVIPNWAALAATPALAKDNPWAVEQQLTDRHVVLYSGTLGRKHDPTILLRLADHLAQRDQPAELVVVSEGPVADQLAIQARQQHQPIRVLPFQPYSRLPEVLASADVLLAVLTADAGTFSVPSKVLTYLCARRPVLASMPPDNLAAQILTEQGAGLVVPPEDGEALGRAANMLLDDAKLRDQIGANARRYAEEHFDVRKNTDRFEGVLEQAARARHQLGKSRPRLPGPAPRRRRAVISQTPGEQTDGRPPL